MNEIALVPLAAAIVTFALVCLPGWLLALRAGLCIGSTVASGFAASFASALATALLAEMVGPLPAWSIGVVALCLSAATLAYPGLPSRLTFPRFPTGILLLPGFTASFSLATYLVGFRINATPATFHAWYNADWFKHLGHTYALTNLGAPARDIFGGFERLHYYWLFYLHPAFGSSLHGDTVNALISFTIVEVFFFWTLLIAFLHKAGIGWRNASLLALFGWLVFTNSGLSAIRASLELGSPLLTILSEEQIGNGLLSAVNTFIPHHLYLLSGLLSFGMLWTQSPRRLPIFRFLAIIPIACAGATSTLMGISVVGIACLTILFTQNLNFIRRLLIASLLGIAAIGIALTLQVVDLSFGQDTLASPSFAGAIDERTPLARMLLELGIQSTMFGLPLGIAAFGLYRSFRSPADSKRPLWILATIMIAVGMLVPVLAIGLTDDIRIVREIKYRSAYQVTIGALLGIAWLMQDLDDPTPHRRLFRLAMVLALLISLPSNAFNFYWHGWSSSRWQTVVPADDMAVLSKLREAAPVDAIVLQRPQAPFVVEEGRDSWVPIFAGRAVPASDRSTNWSTAKDKVAAAERFYTKTDSTIPDEADWIYLSRRLHPDSYELLFNRLQADREWEERACYPNACLFSRADSRSPAQ